jgi:SAM-dependent methyltransferase
VTGTALLQSAEEWDVRNRVLVERLGELVAAHLPAGARRGLDVGCQTGQLTDALVRRTGLPWEGVDPTIDEPLVTPAGAALQRGWAHELPFPDAHFDAVLLANVFEHVEPALRTASLREIARVLVDGGCVVGQIPNPYFPIESHSRLPFMGYLPVGLQRRYWRLSPVAWGHDFQVVTPRHVRRHAAEARLEVVLVRPFNYPPEAVPARLRWAARAVEPLMGLIPWSWQFVLRRGER